VADLARAAGVSLNIKTIRHYTASQMLAEASTWGTPPPGSATPAGFDHAEALRRPGIGGRPGAPLSASRDPGSAASLGGVAGQLVAG